eukprot:gene20752-24923_t
MPDSHAPASASPHGETQGFAVKMMELLVVPTFVLDVHGKVMIWNRACEQLTGVPPAEVLGTRQPGRCFYNDERPTLADLLLSGRSGDMRALQAQQQYRSGTGDNLCAENWCDMPRTGRRRYLAVDASPIHGNHGELIAVVETLRDMTDEKRAHAELERLATRDGLTGLANRRCFDDTVHAEWQRSLKGAAIVAERIRQRVERLQLPRKRAGGACVTVSIGAATALPGPGTELGQLIHTADCALYRAKHLGRNRISLPEATLT